MRQDSRLCVALHILLHMSEEGHVVTSESLGPMLRMNPVVVRRTIAGLRDAGIVQSDKGHGGGWALARGLNEVTLFDVHDALGMPPVFRIGPRDLRPRCLLEQAANRAVTSALDAAEEVLLERLRRVSVADLVRSARPRTPPGRGTRPLRRRKSRA